MSPQITHLAQSYNDPAGQWKGQLLGSHTHSESLVPPEPCPTIKLHDLQPQFPQSRINNTFQNRRMLSRHPSAVELFLVLLTGFRVTTPGLLSILAKDLKQIGTIRICGRVCQVGHGSDGV